ncbi:MAG: type IX secretion system protein PorQ [Tannerella sp.]|nr:type IX secretion system protein PorQ [Tannerella sp.]
MKIYIQLTGLALLFSLSLSAQEGNSVFSFLRLPTSSHANALGGQSVSLIERDPSLVFHNPALLGGEMNGMVNLNYMNYIADIHAGSAIYTKNVGERGAYGLGIVYFNFGSMKEVSAENVILGNFAPQNVSINAFYSHDLSEKWRGGFSFKMLYSGFAEYSSFGLAVDAGLSYFDAEKELSFGLVLKNIGAQLKSYDSRREKLPWDIQMGLTKKMNHAPLRLSVTAMYLTQWKFSYIDENLNMITLDDSFSNTLFKHLVLGVDFIPSSNFWVGIGFNPKINMDMKLTTGNGLGGFSVGGGFRVSGFDVGASVAQYHPSALSLMLSISKSLAPIAP